MSEEKQAFLRFVIGFLVTQKIDYSLLASVYLADEIDQIEEIANFLKVGKEGLIKHLEQEELECEDHIANRFLAEIGWNILVSPTYPEMIVLNNELGILKSSLIHTKVIWIREDMDSAPTFERWWQIFNSLEDFPDRKEKSPKKIKYVFLQDEFKEIIPQPNDFL